MLLATGSCSDRFRTVPSRRRLLQLYAEDRPGTPCPTSLRGADHRVEARNGEGCYRVASIRSAEAVEYAKRSIPLHLEDRPAILFAAAMRRTVHHAVKNREPRLW